MADKRTNVMLTEEDQQLVEHLRRELMRVHGRVSFTFIVRLALRNLKTRIKSMK
jgi:hypothetical protein